MSQQRQTLSISDAVRNTSPTLADVRRQLDQLRRYELSPDRGDQGPLPDALRRLCETLEAAIESPQQVLAGLEEDDTPVPMPTTPFGSVELQLVAEKGLAESLWAGDVNVEQLAWAFSHPIDVRRLASARRDVHIATELEKTEEQIVGAVLPRFQPGAAPSRSPVARSKRGETSPPKKMSVSAVAAVLAVVVLAASGIGVVRAYYEDRLQDERTKRSAEEERRADAEMKLAQAKAELVTLEKARPVPPTPEEQFRLDFEDALTYRVRTYPRQSGHRGRIDIEISPLAQPPYVMAVHLKQGSELKCVYDATFQPLEPPIQLDFSDQLPAAGQSQQTVSLIFSLPGEIGERLGVPHIEKLIPLTLTPNGVRVGIPERTGEVIAGIVEPANGQQVNDRFVTKFTLQALTEKPSLSTGRMVHMLIRAVDGPESVRNEYFVTPFRQRIDELSSRENHCAELVSLRPILDKAASENGGLPRKFDVMLVELPFELLTWTVERNVLDLEGSSAVLVSYQITLNPGVGE